MSPRTRKAFFASLVPAPIMVVALLAFVIGRAPPTHTLPNPNGYDDFVQAGNLVVGDLSSVSDMDGEALRGLISSNAGPLRLLRVGLGRKSSFPTDFALTNHDWMANELPHLKHLAMLLRAEGRLAEVESRPQDAAACYIEAIRFGNEMSRGGFIINRLVGIACEAIGMDRLTKLVPNVTSQQARHVVKGLEEIEAARVSFTEIKANERRFARREIFAQRNPIEWVTGAWEAWRIARISETRVNIMVARERLLMTELALRCYQFDQGRVSARLDDLVNHYLTRVPEDPFTGQPLVYRVKATNWLLYSVGSDGVDHGGLSKGKGSTAKGDIFFDSPW